MKETLAARVGTAGARPESSSASADSYFTASVPLHSNNLEPFSASTRAPLGGIAEGDEGEALAAAVATATAIAAEGAPPALPQSEGAVSPQPGANPFM